MPTDTRTALLNAAERAARTRGIDGFSYADLEKDVGIRKASIHYHFATKAALALALMQRYRVTLERACARIDETCATGGDRLRAVIDVYRQALHGGKSLCLCVSFSTTRASLPPEVIAEVGRFRRMMVGWLETVFETGKKDGTISATEIPALEAAATLSLLEGAQLAARAGEDMALFEEALHLLIRRVP
ncbi:TetR/AcrR family transcriptional regulator [Roseobacter sp. YSTF-M11]|uniref:TetR/AcrR family transcriptional regulator n=1 Tax=Roseobacter insulae TaxID=2859783 RepID=A0A9X1JZP4_9RHOB|nr:TetR family transcriptional regulator [Roseobacter insulae]MBW4707384.1 TetR/AcrR family transcriptional regulator [Roseobacter insulae]